MKSLMTVLLLCLIAAPVNADTSLNCSDPDTIGNNDQHLETCIDQANSSLNEVYQTLRNRHPGQKEKLRALRDMQRGWIRMRDAECLFRSINSIGGGGIGRTALRCKIALTLRRTTELEDL